MNITFRSIAALAIGSLISGLTLATPAPPPPPPPPFLTNVGCSFGDITNATVSACSGFYSNNLLNSGTGSTTDADETFALNALLGMSNASFSVLQKIDDTGGVEDAVRGAGVQRVTRADGDGARAGDDGDLAVQA